MMRVERTAALVPLVVVLTGVTTLRTRDALAAEATIAECITTYEDSIPLRKNHQLKAARAKLLTCSSESCPADIKAECLSRLAEIDASMPTVVFEAKDAAGAIVFGVKVKMDGDVLAERLKGAALPIDPGEHTFTFEVAGRTNVEKHLMIFEGEKLRRERIEFDALAASQPLMPPAAVAKTASVEQPARPAANAWLGKSKVAAVALGVGVAATGVGVAYGFVAMSRRDEAISICPRSQCDDVSGVNAWHDAHSAGNIATGAFIVGAAGIATGVVVWLLAKPPADGGSGPRISVGPGAIQLAGHW